MKTIILTPEQKAELREYFNIEIKAPNCYWLIDDSAVVIGSYKGIVCRIEVINKIIEVTGIGVILVDEGRMIFPIDIHKANAIHINKSAPSVETITG